MTWYPIETAPKDGTRVLGFDKPYQRVVFWDIDRACWHDGEYDFAPTHWMPLPASPSEGP